MTKTKDTKEWALAAELYYVLGGLMNRANLEDLERINRVMKILKKLKVLPF